MLIGLGTLRERIHGVVLNKGEQGHEIDGLVSKLESLPESYDAMLEFANCLSDLPIRSDWKYVEPNGINDIWDESKPDRKTGAISPVDINDSSKRVESAFLGSVAG